MPSQVKVKLVFCKGAGADRASSACGEGWVLLPFPAHSFWVIFRLAQSAEEVQQGIKIQQMGLGMLIARLFIFQGSLRPVLCLVLFSPGPLNASILHW
jgi:hypothetical protein